MSSREIVCGENGLHSKSETLRLEFTKAPREATFSLPIESDQQPLILLLTRGVGCILKPPLGNKSRFCLPCGVIISVRGWIELEEFYGAGKSIMKVGTTHS